MFILITIFITGLMVGRTPEYLGKSIQSKEIKFVMLALIVSTLMSLAPVAWACLNSTALSSLGNPGTHGFSEILYDYTSAAMSNGSTFAGLSTNTPFWNLTLAFVLFFGRYFTMIPMLAIAGSMAQKRLHPENESVFPAHGPIFGGLLVVVILLVGALTHFPAFALGPIAEHFAMIAGTHS
jgi:K+-transporting ATPase ATPase A chain